MATPYKYFEVSGVAVDGTYSASSSFTTDAIQLLDNKYFQYDMFRTSPTTGTPTYTLEVSTKGGSDAEAWKPYSTEATDMAEADSGYSNIGIGYNYARVVYTANGADGTVTLVYSETSKF